MTDLRSQMHARAAELAAVLSNDAGLQATQVAGTVKLKRRRRAVLSAVASFAGIAVVSAGAFLIVSQVRGNEPAVTPSPTASASPSATPSPSPSATPSVSPSPTFNDPGFAGTVTTSPNLPSAQPITPEIWASAGPGWVLVTYVERWVEWPSERELSGPHVAYLVSPQGHRYELTQLSVGQDFHVLWWEPGSTSATIGASAPFHDDVTAVGVLDLVTGVFSAQQQTLATDRIHEWSRRADIDGTSLYPANDDGTAWVKGTAGGLLVAVAMPVPTSVIEHALDALRDAPTDRWCSVQGLASATEMLISCGDSPVAPGQVCLDDFDETCRYHRNVAYALSADGSTRLIYENAADALVVHGTWVVAGQLIGEASAPGAFLDCPVGLAAVSNGESRLVIGHESTSKPEATVYRVAGASGANLYTLVTSGCSGDMAPTVLVRVNLNSGSITELVSYPASATDGWYSSTSVTSAYVVP